MSDHKSTQDDTEFLWQMQAIGQVITALDKGDLTHKVPLEAAAGASWHPEQLQVAKTLNHLTDQLKQFADEGMRVSREMGVEGRLGGSMDVEGASGTWKELTDSINLMTYNYTLQVRTVAMVITAIANGEMDREIILETRGEPRELMTTINVMSAQFGALVSEVTRVAQEIGANGRLSRHAQVRGVSGSWKDVIDNLNIMADSLGSGESRAEH